MNNKDKKLRELMKLPYTVILRRDEEGDFIARIKEFEGCVADGQDEMEALGNLEIVKSLWIETAMDAGKPIPIPEEEEDLPSGKFLVRVPRSLHKKLIDLAKFEGVSLNQMVTVGLAELVGQKTVHSGHVGEITASTFSNIAGPYGSTQRVAKLRLVAPDRSSAVVPEESDPDPQATLEGLLFMQTNPALPHILPRKEA